MCGISGIVGHSDVTAARDIVAGMNACLSHRGPDDEGLYAADGIALGQRRLSIIDTSAAGHQPMFSADGKICLVFNGEIYNFLELKSELDGYSFTSGTDSEVIIAAYLKWGIDCVSKLHGMFAFALWDTDRQELFVARDRLGIKPLYYYNHNGVFIFASELRALLRTGLVPGKLNRDSLRDYFVYQTVFAPATIVRDVKMLMPGTLFIIRNGELTERSYWKISEFREHASNLDYTESCRKVKSLLTEAVEKRLIADVPFGAFLSGGVDSSAIVALMSEVSTSPVKTFSVVFEEKDLNEAEYADLVAKKFNTDHHRINLKVTDFLRKLPEALASMDHPSGDGPNSYVVSEATKNAGITMALSGLGGDELFGGYPVFRRSMHPSLAYLQRTPAFLRKQMALMLTLIRSGVTAEKLGEFLRDERSDIESFLQINRQVIPGRIAMRLLKIPGQPAIRKEGKNFEPGMLLSFISEFEITNYMQNVLLRDTDQMSMAHALEVRVPFLDHKLVEFVLSIPDKNKPLLPGKKLLIDAMGTLLPEQTWNRKKMGFTLPWSKWMKNELASFCADRITKLSKADFVNAHEVTKLWERFRGGDPNIPWTRVWHLVVLSDWMERNSIEA